MISLFSHYPSGSTGVVHPAQWHYVKSGICNNVERIQEYYRLYPHAVSASHYLVRLLQSMEVPMSLSTERYYANVDARGLNLSMSMGMTSSISRGKVFEGIFYGAGSTELLLATDDWFDAATVTANWETATAVKPLMHPKSDLNLLLPNGRAYSKEAGLSVIEINVPKLMVQYRAFVLAQSKNTSGTSKSIYQFIGGYVLPNMLNAHIDIALFNRINNATLDLNDGSNVTRVKHSFIMPDYATQVDVAIVKVLENVSNGVKLFETVLKTLPAFFHHNLYQALIMPDIFATTQVDWSIVATRMKVVSWLLDVTGVEASAKNQAILNQMVRAYRINSVGVVTTQMLPSKAIAEQVSYYEKLLSAAVPSQI